MLGLNVYLGVNHIAHRAESRVPVLPNFGVFLYLCLHPLTQNDQIRHGKAYGEVRVLGGQPCTCVARFVSVD